MIFISSTKQKTNKMDFFEGLARYMQRQAERPSEELLREMLTGREAMPETRIKPKSLKDSQNLLRLSKYILRFSF